MHITPLNIVILAAGKGTRMYSSKPKVLHQLAGKPLLQHVIDCAKLLKPEKIIIIYGFGGELVPNSFTHESIQWVPQTEQLGTGHAVQQAVPYLDDKAKVLILLGDVPLVDVASCKKLLNKTGQLGLMTVNKQNPAGYGRIVRDAYNMVTAIVEQKDADDVQLKINEVNSGIIAANATELCMWLQNIKSDNAQKEFYLTDIVSMAVANGFEVATEITDDEAAVAGINSKLDLATLEREFQRRYALKLLQSGVTLYDPLRIDIRGELETGADVEIDVGCIFEGKVSLADGVKIGAYCVIKDSNIGTDTKVAPFTHIDQAIISDSCHIGPYARLRPGTILNKDAHIGNFVELKNSQVDIGSKINHLSYVGDTSVGKNVNIGAGTITCNYDGANKFRTQIGDNVFIGSDTQLIAPVTIGDGATIGAGSTITKDAPPNQLTISRGRQITIDGWKRPQKVKK